MKSTKVDQTKHSTLARTESIGWCQTRWSDTTAKVLWTKKLISGLQRANCKYRRTLQLWIDQGSFRTFTKRIGKTEERCIYCQQVDTGKHTLFYCIKTTYDKGQIAVGVQLTPKNIIDEDENTFNAIIGLIKKKTWKGRGGRRKKQM